MREEFSVTEQSKIEAPRLYPTMRCRDAEAMIRWLKDVIGFTEYVVYRKDGAVQHAELAYGSSLLMLGQSRDDEYGKLVGDIGGRRTDSLYVAVDDPDALHARIKASGASIEMELHNTDYGSRDFACRDPEGNLWSFGTYWPKTTEKPL
ncbi:VOC family protein [Bradyrhizobium sp. 190]|nr:VOC family protein [Bradyrhizobium sp. 190]